MGGDSLFRSYISIIWETSVRYAQCNNNFGLNTPGTRVPEDSIPFGFLGGTKWYFNIWPANSWACVIYQKYEKTLELWINPDFQWARLLQGGKGMNHFCGANLANREKTEIFTLYHKQAGFQPVSNGLFNGRCPVDLFLYAILYCSRRLKNANNMKYVIIACMLSSRYITENSFKTLTFKIT